MNIQEVVKLTFKAVNQVLYQHNAIISEMQAVLPAKAMREESGSSEIIREARDGREDGTGIEHVHP